MGQLWLEWDVIIGGGGVYVLIKDDRICSSMKPYRDYNSCS